MLSAQLTASQLPPAAAAGGGERALGSYPGAIYILPPPYLHTYHALPFKGPGLLFLLGASPERAPECKTKRTRSQKEVAVLGPTRDA